MKATEKIRQIRTAIQMLTVALDNFEAAVKSKQSPEVIQERKDSLLLMCREMGLTGAVPLTAFEQECLDEAAAFLGHKLNNEATD